MLFHIPGLTTSVLLIAILSLSSSLAIGADDYPSRPIKLMVGASPGGTTDTMARAIAPPLASRYCLPLASAFGMHRPQGAPMPVMDCLKFMSLSYT